MLHSRMGIQVYEKTTSTSVAMAKLLPGQSFLRVCVDSTSERAVEVPITPDTISEDVIEFCRQPYQQHCHLSELWRGCERRIGDGERLHDILLQWGIHRDEVRFFLREDPQPMGTTDGRRLRRKNGVKNEAGEMLPTEVDLTLSELQEMATRQQQQIETQQQMLVAKEQRLKFLKQQELRHQQIASENERLRKLREKVESQELKLKKLRALRGHVNEHKGTNNGLTAELETIKALFNEKEKELAVAVSKVDELTRQLEHMRHAKVNRTNNKNSAALLELEKLRKELVMRNKLNEAQNSKLAAHREVLVQRKEEVTYMDQRIAELQARLRKKKAMQKEAATKEQQQQQHQDSVYNLANQMRSQTAKLGPRAPSTNVAAVEPYIQHKDPKDSVETDQFVPDKGDPMYRSLPYSIKFAAGESNGKDPGGTGMNLHEEGMRPDGGRIPEKAPSEKADLTDHSRAGKMSEYKPASSHSSTHPSTDVPGKPSDTSAPASRSVYGPGYKPGITNFGPRPYGTTFGTSMLVNRPVGTNSSVHLSPPAGSINSPGAGYPKTSTPNHGQSPETKGASPQGKAENKEIFITGAAPSQPYNTVSSSSQHQPYSSSGAPSSVTSPASSASYYPGSRPGAPIYQIASSRPQLPPTPQQAQLPPSPLSSSAPTSSHLPSYQHITRPTIPPPPPPQFSQREEASTDFRGKSPVNEPSTAADASSQSPVSQPQLIPSRSRDPVDDSDTKPDISGTSVSSALSVLKAGSPPGPKASYRYAPKSVIANTYLKKLGSSNLDQYKQNMNDLYRNFITSQTIMADDKGKPSNSEDSKSQSAPQGSAAGQLTVLPPGEQSGNQPSQRDSDSPQSSDSPILRDAPSGYAEVIRHDMDAERSHYRPNAPKLRRRSSSGETDDLRQFQTKMHSNQQDDDVFGPPGHASPSHDVVRVDTIQDSYNNNQQDGRPTRKVQLSNEPIVPLPQAIRKKTNLKRPNYIKSSRRVSFDPLALLLDASLEGELDLVRRTAAEVSDPSAANDEGITALHNAICAGHYEIVKFLVEFGCNVNSPDSDGWTPLHCAASCNNLPMVKILVEHGACIFATTISDQETAAEKCEEDEDGYDGCSEYLYSIQEKLGIINKGVVYAVFDYKSQNPDELDFRDGNGLTVLRKGDEQEKDWWWARQADNEGYIPRNLLGLFPRVRLQSQGGSSSGS